MKTLTLASTIGHGLATLGLLAGLAAGAAAQPATPVPAASPPATRAQAGPLLNIRQIYDLMEAAGYRDLREIEWSDGRYEVKGRNARGERVKLEVDGQTGAVLRERTRR
jgi:hypothetical protein